MNLIDRIKSAFGSKPAVPTLRNKPGGMAWVNFGKDSTGLDDLQGRFVCTRRLAEGMKWELDPPQDFVASANYRWGSKAVLTGDRVTATAIHDSYLVPIPAQPISDSEVRELYAPKLPEAA